MPLFSKIVYLITLVIVLVLGTYSLYDYLQLKRGKPSGMKLQLPDFLKKSIHRIIREKSRSRHYLIAAVVAGFIISLLEFTCTGQVYLPTILFVTKVPSLRGSAISYLLLYNLMFIIPLLTIFGAAYWDHIRTVILLPSEGLQPLSFDCLLSSPGRDTDCKGGF
jgi:hypothetical protein